MTKFKITNDSHRSKAFKVAGGMEEVLPGKSRTLDIKGGLTDRFIREQTALGVKFEEVGGKSAEPAGDYTVVDKSGGWFVVQQDGKDVTKSLRADDVKDFDAKSDADKAAFVEANKAA